MRLPRPSEGGTFVLPPKGLRTAICYRIVDLGTQETTYNGERKSVHKVMLSFELKGDKCLMPDTGLPMTIHSRYTWSMHEKALLRKHLEGWRGESFSDADFGKDGFDVRQFLGKACTLTIVHRRGNSDRVFANVESISEIAERAKPGKLVNKQVLLSLDPDEFDRAAFEQLSERIKDTIKDSPEYQKLAANGKRKATRGGDEDGDSDSVDNESDFSGDRDDRNEIPF